MISQFLPFVLVFALTQTATLNSSSPRERRDAIRSMAVLGNRTAVPALVEAYRNEASKDIRAEIVAGLGKIRDRSAVPGLVEAFRGDFRKEVRLQALDSLIRLYIPIADNEGFFSFIGDVRNVFSREERPELISGTSVDPETIDALVESVQHDFDAEVRRESAYALGSLRAGDRLATLLQELEGPRQREDSEVRIALTRTVGRFRDVAAGPALTRLIRDPDDSVAEEAIQAVGLIGYRAAYPVLSNLFRGSNDGDVREQALQSIALMREPDAQAFLESLLDDREDKYRELAAEGLARLDYSPTSFAGRYVTERNANVRMALAFGLVTSGDMAYMPPLIAELDTRRSSQAEAYLYELGRFEGRIDAIYPHLRNPDADIRERLLRVLGRIGDPAARPYVEPLVRDRNNDVAAAAVAALRQLQGR